MRKLLDMAKQLSERYLISDVMELPEQAEDQVYYCLLYTSTYHFPVLAISIYFVMLFFILAAYSVFSVRYSKRHRVIERVKTME